MDKTARWDQNFFFINISSKSVYNDIFDQTIPDLSLNNLKENVIKFKQFYFNFANQQDFNYIKILIGNIIKKPIVRINFTTMKKSSFK